MRQAFFKALDAIKRTNSLDNAVALQRAFDRDNSVAQELSEPDLSLVRQACKISDRAAGFL